MNCFNGEKYLREAIDSVIAQTYMNWEIIFWDNRSTDLSAEIFRSYQDPRLKYFLAPKHTLLYEARNCAIRNSRGELLAFLDVDDWWTPDKLARQVPLFSDAEVGLVCGNYWIESERKQRRWKALSGVVPTGRVLRRLLDEYFVGLPTLVVRRSAVEALGHACDPRFHVMGDFDLVVRLAAEWKLDCVQEPVAHYRLHHGNETANNRRRQIEEMDVFLSEISENERVRASGGLPGLRAQRAYMRGMFELFELNRGEALRWWRQLSWGRRKLRLGAALLLPSAVARKLRQ
jgi:glycosyltransferase involved in cell wall biosynthesis